MPIKLRGVRGDGQVADGDQFDVVLRDPTTNQTLDDVVVRCRVVSKARAREISRAHQERVPDPTSRQMTWRYKEQGPEQATDAMLAEAVVSWRGILGADDRALVCTPATIAALDDRIKMQLVLAIFGAEVVEDASFREPPALQPVVAAAWPDDALLSAGGRRGTR